MDNWNMNILLKGEIYLNFKSMYMKIFLLPSQQKKNYVTTMLIFSMFIMTLTLTLMFNLSASFGSDVFSVSQGASDSSFKTVMSFLHTWSMPVAGIAFVISLIFTEKTKQTARGIAIGAAIAYILSLNDGVIITSTLDLMAGWFGATGSTPTQ